MLSTGDREQGKDALITSDQYYSGDLSQCSEKRGRDREETETGRQRETR